MLLPVVIARTSNANTGPGSRRPHPLTTLRAPNSTPVLPARLRTALVSSSATEERVVVTGISKQASNDRFVAC
ncbi:MAG: hypothetical protein ACRDRY_08690, partial [Pseudonocardiaceae bacterium]